MFPCIITILVTSYLLIYYLNDPKLQNNHKYMVITNNYYLSTFCDRAAGTYEDMRTGPHHVLGIKGGKSGFYGYM